MPDHRDDRDLFERATADVRRLRPDERGRVPPPRSARAQPEPRVTRNLPTHTEPEEEREDNAFAAPGVDRRVLRKLTRGEYEISAELDLHGLRAQDALAEVAHLLDSSHRRHRCVRIVHGRGLHSGGVAVLKQKVREYLRRHPSVLAFTDAPRQQGGAGAVVVWLRR